MHSICRIAEVLLTLQQVGNVKYTGWILQVPCSTDRRLINMLQQRAKDMEDELHQWRETVRCRRKEFYELNYYNTMQLLNLRKELGKLITSEGSLQLSPDVLALLQSISSQVTPQIVSDVLCKVRIEQSAEFSEHTAHPEEIREDNESSIELPPKSIVNEHMPKLTEVDLSETQKEILATLTTRLNISSLLVLKAFEECPKESDYYDYQRWCLDNIHMDALLDVAEDDNSEAELDDAASSESEYSETEGDKFNYSTGICMKT